MEWPLQMQMSGIFTALRFRDHKAGLRLLLCFPSLSTLFLLQERGWHNWESGSVRFSGENTILQQFLMVEFWNFLFKTGCSFLHTLHQRPVFPKSGVLQGSISLTSQLGGVNSLLLRGRETWEQGRGAGINIQQRKLKNVPTELMISR